MNFFCRCFFIAALLLVCQPASAEKRVALVLGNSNYKHAAMLPNPVNDAAAVAATLKRAGFDIVDSRLDLSAADMRRALRDFADQCPPGDDLTLLVVRRCETKLTEIFPERNNKRDKNFSVPRRLSSVEVGQVC